MEIVVEVEGVLIINVQLEELVVKIKDGQFVAFNVLIDQRLVELHLLHCKCICLGNAGENVNVVAQRGNDLNV